MKIPAGLKQKNSVARNENSLFCVNLRLNLECKSTLQLTHFQNTTEDNTKARLLIRTHTKLCVPSREHVVNQPTQVLNTGQTIVKCLPLAPAHMRKGSKGKNA